MTRHFGSKTRASDGENGQVFHTKSAFSRDRANQILPSDSDCHTSKSVFAVTCSVVPLLTLASPQPLSPHTETPKKSEKPSHCAGASGTTDWDHRGLHVKLVQHNMHARTLPAVCIVSARA
ncbi:hypothetical protein BaRGS_00001533, partial [Batillaria attramentaria]